MFATIEECDTERIAINEKIGEMPKSAPLRSEDAFVQEARRTM